jgi:hypothetical protein
MGDATRTLLPLFAFMLIPLWIPLIAIAVGAVFDRLGSDTVKGQAGAILEVRRRSSAKNEQAASPVTA